MDEIKDAIESYHDATAEGLGALQDRLEKLESRMEAKSRFEVESKAEGSAALEHKQAFRTFLRNGDTAPLKQLETKALSTATDADGGYAVPEAIDKDIDRVLRDISPLRQIARTVGIGTSDYKKLVNIGGATSGWVGETDARTETDTPRFAEVIPPLGEIYANPAATQHMLDDAFFNVEDWLAEEIAGEIAIKEGAAFVAGNGANKPKGILTYPTASTGDDTRAFGTLQYVATGVDGDWPASDPVDVLIDLVHSLKAGYRQNAHWLMNTTTVARIRKFKDADGNYIWRDGNIGAGQPPRLLGYPVVEAEDMPDIASGSFSVAFGDFRRGYLITDRMGTRVLRDPYSNKPFVHLYTTKRVGGGLIDSQAIKLLKFGVS